MGWLSDNRNDADAQSIKVIVKAAYVQRWFDMAELLAATAVQRIDATPATRRLHAQMLMERGFSEEALARLRGLLAGGGLPQWDGEEAAGHIGRIFKDRFLEAVAARDEATSRVALRESLRAYLDAYSSNSRNVWHGINAVALLSRPEAEAVLTSAKEQATGIAHAILEDAVVEPDEYTPATLAEAHIALGDYKEALTQIRAYTSDPRVSPFQLATFHKQLTKLWMLDREPTPGPELVAMVAAALLEREGGAFQLSGRDIKRDIRADAESYQQVFGADRFNSLANYRRGLDRSACVARIGRSSDTGLGTGFIVKGSSICPRFGDGTVLVTNAHVISEDRALQDKGSLDPSEAVVTFEALAGAEGREFLPGAVLFSSEPTLLDVTILELSDVSLPDLYPIAPKVPMRDSVVHVIGHPSGRSLSFSSNQLLAYEEPLIHYRTATEGGSSGSPVFNQEWRLIGLHHAGGTAMRRLDGEGTYEANEGVWIRAICAAASQ
jgi:S1-C subfamily serine protease